MSDVELRDELLTLLTAGHETTATGLSWAFERLMRTPRVMARLLESLDDDEYLDAVVKETLRVRPVIVDVARKLTRETEVAGYTLPAGTLVLPAIAAVHVRPDLYPEPFEFRPERFIDGQPESYAWIPVRGRRAALHRRVVRPDGDAGGAARGAEAGAAQRALGAARAPAGAARDRGARARRARGGDGADAGGRAGSPPLPPSPSCYCGTSGRDSTGGCRLDRPAAADARLSVATLVDAPHLVQLALRVPEAHGRDEQHQDEDHGSAGGTLDAHRLLRPLNAPGGGPLGHDRRHHDQRTGGARPTPSSPASGPGPRRAPDQGPSSPG